MTQHNRETLLALADRCEMAKGGDRELDAAIAVALGLPNGPHEIVYYESRSVTYIEQQALPFSASLDATMSLVPEGWCFEVTNFDTFARVMRGIVSHGAGGDTPALALCAAALRARATLDPTGEKA